MTMPECAAPTYADHMSVVTANLESVVPLARDTYRVRVAAPQIAATAVPGQFVMIRLADRHAPLIGRALAVWDVIDDAAGRPYAIDLVFVRKGALTEPLSNAAPGTPVTVWGPLGNGFEVRPCRQLVLASGGVGQTPMLLVAKEALGLRQFGNRPSGWTQSVRLVYGARSADLLAGLDEFRAAGIDLQLCTDDGSLGRQMRVPDFLFQQLDAEVELPGNQASDYQVLTCGPEIMMHKVAEGCLQRQIGCQVSMETPMACGIGICFSCVAMVRPAEDRPWDYKRTCVEGPVFDAAKIVW